MTSFLSRVPAHVEISPYKSREQKRLIGTDGQPLSPDDLILVYHSTSKANAESLLKTGFRVGQKNPKPLPIADSPELANMLKVKLGEPSPYGINHGKGPGIYFSLKHEPLYGEASLCFPIRVGDLMNPPERKSCSSPEWALLLDDGYAEINIPAKKFVSQMALSQVEKSDNEIFEYVKSMHMYPEDLHGGDLGDRIYRFSKYALQTIPLSQIESPWEVHTPTAEDYSKMGDKIPAIVVFKKGQKYIVIDGSHRLAAAKLSGKKEIDAWVGVAKATADIFNPGAAPTSFLKEMDQTHTNNMSGPSGPGATPIQDDVTTHQRMKDTDRIFPAPAQSAAALLEDVIQVLKDEDSTDDDEFVADLIRRASKFKTWELRQLDPKTQLDLQPINEDSIEGLDRSTLKECQPIVVIPGGEGGLYEILDGNHRANAAWNFNVKIKAYVPKTPVKLACGSALAWTRPGDDQIRQEYREENYTIQQMAKETNTRLLNPSDLVDLVKEFAKERTFSLEEAERLDHHTVRQRDGKLQRKWMGDSEWGPLDSSYYAKQTLPMPILFQKDDGSYVTFTGRTRVGYAVSISQPVRALVLPYGAKLVELLYPSKVVTAMNWKKLTPEQIAYGKELIASLPGPSKSAAPSPSMKNGVFYHGTTTEQKAMKIWKEGIKPDLSDAPDTSISRPVAGRVYFSSNLDEVMPYLLGANCAGNQHFPNYEHKWGRYGYLFVIPGNQLTDVHPDEDQVGKAVYKKSFTWLTALAKKLLAKEYAPEGDYSWDKPLLDSVYDGEYESWITAGKLLLPHLTDKQKLDIIKKYKNVAHTGMVMPSEMWRFDRRRTAELKGDGSNFFQVSERVEKRTPEKVAAASSDTRRGGYGPIPTSFLDRVGLVDPGMPAGTMKAPVPTEENVPSYNLATDPGFQAEPAQADQDADRTARTEAEEVCKSLIRYLKTNQDAIQASVETWKAKKLPRMKSDTEKNAFFWDRKGALWVSGKHLDHPVKAWFVFSHESDSGYKANFDGHAGLDGSIFMFGFLKAAWDPSYLATRINDSVFTHEYTHHQDSLRQKGEMKNSATKLRHDGAKAYFNDPHEFNAYYQDGLSTLHSLLERKGDSWLTDDMKRKLLRDTFAEFAKETFRQGFSKDFLSEIEPKYKRKLLKRLYGFWMDQRKRLSVGSYISKVTAAAEDLKGYWQYYVNFKGYKPTGNGYAKWTFTKKDLKHILSNWSSIVEWHDALWAEKNVAKSEEEDHQTTIDRTKQGNKPATPLSDHIAKEGPQKGRCLYHGVGQDFPGQSALMKQGMKVDVYDKFAKEYIGTDKKGVDLKEKKKELEKLHGIKINPSLTRTKPEDRPGGAKPYDKVHSHYTLNVVDQATGKQILKHICDLMSNTATAVISVRRDTELTDSLKEWSLAKAKGWDLKKFIPHWKKFKAKKQEDAEKRKAERLAKLAPPEVAKVG